MSEIRPSLPALFAAAFVGTTVFCILQVALLISRGRADTLIRSHKALELVAALGGLVIAGAAISDLLHELQHASPHKASKTHSAAPDANRPSR